MHTFTFTFVTHIGQVCQFQSITESIVWAQNDDLRKSFNKNLSNLHHCRRITLSRIWLYLYTRLNCTVCHVSCWSCKIKNKTLSALQSQAVNPECYHHWCYKGLTKGVHDLLFPHLAILHNHSQLGMNLSTKTMSWVLTDISVTASFTAKDNIWLPAVTVFFKKLCCPESELTDQVTNWTRLAWCTPGSLVHYYH